MRLDTKMGIGSVLMALVCGGSGLYGVAAMSDLLSNLTGPTWDTADGAMEGSIEIEAQLLAVQNIMDEVDIPGNQEALASAREGADEALNRMTAAQLLETAQTDKLQGYRKSYEESLSKVLTSFDQYIHTRTEFEANAHLFVETADELEEVADAAVEELADNPDAQISWNTGLNAKWEAADGAMHSRIGLLTQLHVIGKLTRGLISGDEFDQAIEEGLHFPLFAKLKTFILVPVLKYIWTRFPHQRPIDDGGTSDTASFSECNRRFPKYWCHG